MPCIVVSILKSADRGAFVRKMQEAGLDFTSIGGLHRHFIVHGTDVSRFPLRDHPAVEAIDDGDQEAQPPLAQPIVLDAVLSSGSWAIARAIRRSAPWLVDHLQHPIRTYYRAKRAGLGVDLYVLDTGIDTPHAEFEGRAENVYEYASSGGLGDDNGHGTLCASVAAGATVGLARGAYIFGFKCSVNAAGGSNAVSVATTIGQVLLHYAGRVELDRPAVANLSINPTIGSTAVSAVGDLIDAGIVPVLSAGNEMENLSPGRHPLAFTDGVIVVGGCNMADLPYWVGTDGTNYGARVDLLAPGLAVLGAAATVRGVGPYEARRGTSVSAPVVSGVVACMLEGHSRLAGRQQVLAVKNKLIDNATTGKLRPGFGLSPLPNRIVYLNPDQAAPEPIAGI